MKYLIVNADDFGYSSGVNKGIIKAHIEGIVTSTSVMVDAVTAYEAKDLVQYQGLAVGLHFVPSESTPIAVELQRQVDKLIAITGKQPSHIDIHKVREGDIDLKDTVNIYAHANSIPTRYSGTAKFISSFFGPHAAGDVSVAQLKKSISEATEPYNELMCHVGFADEYLLSHSSYSTLRENELESVCDNTIKEFINKLGLKLANWELIGRE